MKSLVEEASSIAKAIEKAWIRAGQPQAFSIKIFETPEVGFLGFTKKSAKVGIFFEEPTEEKTHKKPYSRPLNKRDNRKPSEHYTRPNAVRKEQGDENKEQVRDQTRHPQRDDRREPRAVHHREDSREIGPKDNNNRRNNRPQHNRNSDRPHTRPQRAHHPERPAQDPRPENRPAQENITPVSKPQVTTPQAPLVKRPPKFSGRRFSSPKKDETDKS